MIMRENLQNEQSSCSFLRDKQISHYGFVLQKHCDYWLEKQTLMLRCVSQMLKKWRIVMQLVICLLVKLVRFHIAVWSLSKSVRASSFIENFRQISAKLIAFQRNLLGKLLRNRPFFTNRLSVKLASKIPAKFPRNRPFFPANLPPKIPRNLTFSPATYQKPWIYVFVTLEEAMKFWIFENEFLQELVKSYWAAKFDLSLASWRWS